MEQKSLAERFGTNIDLYGVIGADELITAADLVKRKSPANKKIIDPKLYKRSSRNQANASHALSTNSRHDNSSSTLIRRTSQSVLKPPHNESLLFKSSAESYLKVIGVYTPRRIQVAGVYLNPMENYPVSKNLKTIK